MNIDQELASLSTKSAKIRFLSQEGLSRSQIAQKLGIKYQHVRNVLVSTPPQAKPLAGDAPVYAALMEKLRKIAETERVSPQALVEEALSDFIEKKRKGGVRPQVMLAYEQSLKDFDALYQKLAK